MCACVCTPICVCVYACLRVRVCLLVCKSVCVCVCVCVRARACVHFVFSFFLIGFIQCRNKDNVGSDNSSLMFSVFPQ